MAKLLADAALDLALNLVKNNCNLMVACSQQPTTYTQATSTYALASVAMTSGNYTLADGDIDGRKLTTAAKNTVAVTTSGTITHVALVDTTNSVLYIVTTTTSQAVTAGNTIDFPAWALALADVFLAEGVGPLRVSSTNPRYFTDGAGRGILLTGFHTWYCWEDGGTSDPPVAFDYDDYITRMVARGCNFFRGWRLENARYWADDSAALHYFGGTPYARTGPSNALDGKLKFDLNTWNQTFFDTVRKRIIQAGQRGIYCSVMLFEAFTTESKGQTTNPWLSHPYNSSNNINSLDGDPNSTGDGQDCMRLVSTPVLDEQKKLVRKFVDELNDLDNIVWEICNESNSTSQDWQYALIDYVKSYESGKPKQHLVWMTVEWPGGDNAELTAAGSHADLVSGNGSISTPAIWNGDRPHVYDTDHTAGLTTDTGWMWKSFCRGYHPLFMDEWNSLLYQADQRNNSTLEEIRYNCGYILTYAKRMSLLNCTPNTTLCSTGYCLVNTNVEYLCYQPGSGAFTLDLSAASGTFNIEWLRQSTGTVQSGGTTTGGATRTLTPPSGWSPAIAYVYK